MTDEEIKKLADIIFKKLVAHWKQMEVQNNQFVISDEFGNQKTVTEIEYLSFELEKLQQLEQKYVDDEAFEKASIIQNKIKRILNKIKNL